MRERGSRCRALRRCRSGLWGWDQNRRLSKRPSKLTAWPQWALGLWGAAAVESTVQAGEPVERGCFLQIKEMGASRTAFLFGRQDAAACPTAEGQEAEELAPCRAQCGCAALGRGACQAPPVSQATKGLHPDPPQTRGGHTGHTGNNVLPKL